MATFASEEIFLSWYGAVYEDRAAYDSDPTTELTDDRILAAIDSAATVVTWPAGVAVSGRFEAVEPDEALSYEPRLRWHPDGETHGWQALVIDYTRLPASFRYRGTPAVDGRMVTRFNTDSAPVVIDARVRDITTDDALIAEGGVSAYPDGHMVAISFSEPLANTPDLHGGIRVADWPGCVPYRYVPTSETVQTVSLQCPRRADVGTADRGTVRAEVSAGLMSGVGATVQSAYQLANPDDTVVIEIPPDPDDLSVWVTSRSELARAAGLDAP